MTCWHAGPQRTLRSSRCARTAPPCCGLLCQKVAGTTDRVLQVPEAVGKACAARNATLASWTAAKTLLHKLGPALLPTFPAVSHTESRETLGNSFITVRQACLVSGAAEAPGCGPALPYRRAPCTCLLTAPASSPPGATCTTTRLRSPRSRQPFPVSGPDNASLLDHGLKLLLEEGSFCM